MRSRATGLPVTVPVMQPGSPSEHLRKVASQGCRTMMEQQSEALFIAAGATVWLRCHGAARAKLAKLDRVMFLVPPRPPRAPPQLAFKSVS